MNIFYSIYIFSILISYSFQYNKLWLWYRITLSFIFLIVIIFQSETEKNRKEYEIVEENTEKIIYEYENGAEVIDLSKINLDKDENT